jgi:hypothetical protein
VVVSPSTPADLSFCGEATVEYPSNNGGILSTGTSALKASVAVKDLDGILRRLDEDCDSCCTAAVNGTWKPKRFCQWWVLPLSVCSPTLAYGNFAGALQPPHGPFDHDS